jgi:hypothetical protein
LSDAGLKERQHLQEWVRLNPSILGDGVIVVTFEFDKWIDATGKRVEDRLDVLGIDQTGSLVVVELKRDVAADSTEMQAIKYAAMASRFTLKTLAQHHAKYLSKVRGATVDDAEAMEALRKHIDDYDDASDDDPRFERPRIVLMARDFPTSVTASAVFLSESGLDITLLRFQAYKTPQSEHVVVVSRLFPIQEIEAFRVSPRALGEVAEKKSIEARQQRAVLRIIDHDALPAGTELTLVPPAGWTERLRDTLTADPKNGKANWDPADHANPLKWQVDGVNYSPSGLCRKIITDAGHEPPTYQYPTWWQIPGGKTLVDVASELEGV